MQERDIQEVIDVILLTMQSVEGESDVLTELTHLREGAFRRREQRMQSREVCRRYRQLQYEMKQLECDYPEVKEKKIAY